MRVLVACAWVMAAVAVAHADPGAGKPWAAGVSDAEQARALAIFEKGNTQFEEARYTEALALYREALTHWDHPSIRFNMVVCLVNLDQPLEAYDDLDKALRYGAAPLGNASYEQALTYKKLLAGQLATVEIKSGEAGAEVRFDGVALFTAPGDATKVVTPGNHQIVATKPGFAPAAIPLVLLGGKTTVEDVRLMPLQPGGIARRWAPWKPWLVVGAGAAIAIAGGILEVHAHDDYDSYDAGFAKSCAAGCGGPTQMPIPATLASLERRARLDNDAAVAMFAVGGAALVAGLVGVYLAQPYAVEKPVTVAPVVTGTAAGFVVGGSF
jgi:hypothetical protein|nr:hypothetical protein [Kofleriaceae bacterium]